jgi:Na+-driven multidrug efflux pump
MQPRRAAAGGKTAPMLAGPPTYRTLFWLALPTLVEQLIGGVIGLTDTLVAGHGKDAFSNTAASAAVGTMTYLMWFCGLMGSALGVGATAIVSRSIGANRPRVATRVAGTALTAAILVGVAVGGLLYAFAPFVVSAFSLTGDAYRFGVEYLRIMSVTVALQTVAQIGLACLRGAGDLVRPMLVTASVAVINLVTVPALAYGWFGLPAWGIKGNAVGTMLAFTVSGVATLWLITSGKAKLRLRRRHFRIVPHVLRRVLRVSLPSWAEGILLWGGQFIVVAFVNKMNDHALSSFFSEPLEKLSGLTMSTHNAVLRVESFAFLPGFGIAIATSALVGQFLGAKKPDDAHKTTLVATRLAVITMTLAAVPMVFLPVVLMRGMVDNAHAAQVGIWPMVLAGLAQPGFAVAIIMGGALKGAGDTVSVMLSTVIGMFLVRFPVLIATAWLFARAGHPECGLIAVWVGIFVDLNFRAVYNSVVFFRGAWKTRKV